MTQRILLSLAVLAAVGGGAIASTGAFFSDSETSTGNSFTAGAIDLKVDSTQHYDGLVCDIETHKWVLENQGVPSARPELIGKDCGGSWALKDLLPGTDKFFNFTDVKPGDSGENTISLHIDNNDAYACADVTNILNNDNATNTPEMLAGDTTATDPGAGELAQNLDFLIWNDNGGETNTCNNVWDANETGSESKGAPTSPATYTLSDSSNPPIPGGGTSCLGIAWCAGTFTAGGPGVAPVCNGTSMGNDTQTDSYAADVALRVVQARNNGSFKCQVPTGGIVLSSRSSHLSRREVLGGLGMNQRRY